MKNLKKVFNRQGKTESQMKASYLGAFVGFVGMSQIYKSTYKNYKNYKKRRFIVAKQ